MKKIKKIVLAYSGGLDTSVILKWLQDKYNAEIICYTSDLGQEINRKAIYANAKKLGVKKIIIEDLKEKFVKDYVRKYNTTTLWKLSKLVDEKFKVSLNDKSIYNILHKYKLTRKRLRSKYYPEKKEGQEKEDLEDFYKNLKEFDYKRTICLDETSIYLNMTLTYGRSKSGTRVIKKTNKYPYKRYNLLCAISADKVIGWKLYPERKGGVKTEDILEFYDEFIHTKYKNYLIITKSKKR